MTVPDPAEEGRFLTTDAPRRIVLVGFMGAGKTTVGKMLAARLGWRFLDADAEIEAETGSTIGELFARHGEPWFRALERGTIARLMGQADGPPMAVAAAEPGARSFAQPPAQPQAQPPAQPPVQLQAQTNAAGLAAAAEAGRVLALGGGAIEDAQTRELLRKADGVCLVHLEVTLAEAIRRCAAEETNVRPVLADSARLAARYEQRLALYRLAHRTVEVDGLTPEQVTERIWSWLRSWPGENEF